MKGGDAPVTTAEPKAPAANNKIPDEWFDDDYGPSPESDKREPDGFTDRLVEKFRKALQQSRGSPICSLPAERPH
jgi:hypothetical protein